MTFDVSRTVRSSLNRQSASLYDPYAVPASGTVRPTYNAVRSVIAPPSSAVQALSAQTGQEYPKGMPVPGQLGTWQPSEQYKPHQMIGKFGVNLLGPSPTTMPGQVQPWTEQYQQVSAEQRLMQMANPDNPDNRGFFEGLFSGFGGLVGDVGRTVGGFVGSVVDAPLEMAGNLAGLPLSIASGAAFGGEWDEEVQAAYDAAAAESPFNGLLLWGQAAKAQWQKDVEAGRMTGLWADYGPATALTDQLGLAMNIILGGPSRGVQRWIAGMGPGAESFTTDSIKAVENAVRNGATTYVDPDTGAVKSTDEAIKNDNWAQIQMRLGRGDFGPVGSQEARDKMIDQLIIEGAMLRDVGDVEQTSPVFVTPQGLADIGISMLTDPWMLASFGIVGGATKAAKLAQVGANDLLLAAVPKTSARAFMDVVEEVGMRELPGASPEQVWNRLARATRAQVTSRIEGGLQVPSQAVDRAFENKVYRTALREFEGGKYAKAGESAWTKIERWRDVWEPAMRPVVNTVNAINDPFSLFGKDRASRLMGNIFSSHVTEGVIRGQGSLDDHAALQKILKGTGIEDAVGRYDKGLGVYAGHESKVYARAGFVGGGMKARLELEGEESIRGILSMYPEEAVRARLNGSTPGDIASALEMQVLRYRPKYLFAGRSKQASLDLGREQATQRLMRMMDMPEDVARQAAEQLNFNQISLIDGSYFGWAMDQFVAARKQGMKLTAKEAKDINYETLTMLGPRQMTKQSADDVLAMVKRGDIGAVRQAIQEYDLLFENLSTKAGEDDLLRAVDILVRDQRKVLPNEIEDLSTLSPEMRAWAESNKGFGYKLGHRPEKPEDMWRVTMDPRDPKKVLGVNPWIDPSSDIVTDPVNIGRWGLAKDTLFHNIRGERIMQDAKIRLGEITTRNWGISPQQSDALFARFLKQAQTEGITPRGMRAEAVYKIVMTHGLGKDIEDRIGKSQAVEALLFAFEGNWKHVGTSQKFTGYAKTTLGGQGNYLGQVAEKIYPMVRFSLNPLFQAQELAEPFILNIMRGVKPGIRANEADAQTIRAVEFLLGDSKFAFDDAIEYGGSLLMGGNQAHTAFGANTALGKIVRRAGEHGVGWKRGFRRMEVAAAEGAEGATYKRFLGIDVQGIKKVNYARALRKRLGKEMQDTLVGMSERGITGQFIGDVEDVAAREAMAKAGSVAARMLHELPLHYGTSDWGEIAIKYLTDKGNIPEHLTPTALFKPSTIGRLEPVKLEDLVPYLDQTKYGSVEEVQAAVRAGDLDLPAFRDLLTAEGVTDDHFIERAWRRAGADWTTDEWWDGWQRRYNATAADRRAARTIVRNAANAMGLDEQDYLLQRMAKVPQSVDEAHLAALPLNEKIHLQRHGEVQSAVDGRTASANARVTKFMHEEAYNTDREKFLIARRDSGDVLHRGQANEAWEMRPDGMYEHAMITGDVLSEDIMRDAEGQIMAHTHPTHNTHSPADMASAARYRPDEELVVTPGIIHSLRGHEEQGWYTDEFIAMFGEPPVPATGGMDVDEAFAGALDEDAYWMGDDGVRGRIQQMWLKEGFEEKQRLLQDPFFSARADDGFYNWYAEQLASEHATREVSRRLGWRFHSETNFNLPTDEFEKTRAVNEMMDSAPEAQRRLAPQAYGHERFTRTDVAHGTDIDVAYTSRHRSWEPPGLSDEDWRIVSTAHEDWARAKALTMLGMAVTDVRRNMAVREGGNAAHIVWNALGPDDMHDDAARMMGLLLKQDRVEVSEVIPNGMVADPAQSQRWSFNMVADRQMTDDEADALAASLSAAMGVPPPTHVITRDGRTALRFVERDLSAPMTREAFAVTPLGQAARSQAVSDIAEGSGIAFEFSDDVLNWRSIENDWSVNPNGEAYLEGIRVRRGDVARRIEHGLLQESENKLASLLRAVDPERFDAHLASLADAGTPAPRFTVPGEYTSQPLADRVTVNLPGGVERLLNDPLAEYTLWEQQGIKALMLDPVAIYNADPLLGVRLHRALWRGKYKNLDGVLDLEDHYNAFAYGHLTPAATLEQTEGAYSLVRASKYPAREGQEAVRNLQALNTRFRRIVNRLIPPDTRDEDILGVIEGLDDAAVGFQVQIDEGLMVPSTDLYKASWLDSRTADRIDAYLADLDQRLAGMTPEARKEYVPRLQAELSANPPEGVQIAVTDYPLASVDNRTANLQDAATGEIPAGADQSFTAVVRPDTQFKGRDTNVQWGRIAKQHASGLWTSENPAVLRFLKPMPGESRAAYGLRMPSILPGMDPQTGLRSMHAASTGMVDHAALDPRLTGFVIRKAQQRGEWDFLRERLSATFGGRADEALRSGVDEFPVPPNQHDFLVPDEWKGKPWSAGKEAAMRERLPLIRDPEARALYDDSEVLRYVAQTNGRIDHMEGDYFVLNDYLLSIIRDEEADALRAAGHTQAADELLALSGGDYATMKASHVAGAEGIPLDPHVSIARNAELFSPRSGAEQARNLTVGSLTKTPYDPSRMRLQQIDGQILGATQIDDDGRAILMATQHADARTGLHELAHVLWGDLDDSAKITVLREYRLATGSRVRSLNNRGLQEWWADSLYAYGQSKGAKGNEQLRSSFEHVRKTLDGIEAEIKTQRKAATLVKTKKQAVTRASKAVERYKQPLRDAKIVTSKASTARKTAADNLRKVRQRTGVRVFEAKADQAKVAVQVAEQNLKDARTAVRIAKEQARLAETKAKSALGTPQAGGARRAANAKAAQIAKAEAEVARLNKALDKTLRPARTEANIALRNARRRLPVEELEGRHRVAVEAHERALAKQRQIQRQADDAAKALTDAKGMSTKPPKQKADQMPMSDPMRKVWKGLTTPPEKPSMVAPVGSHYNIQEEAVYQAMQHALSRAEENAHTLHYYARGRNLIERSINHPYFGLYPSSYMWGKILPELTRFLLKNPFGLDAPLGGLALSHNLYRQVMTRQTYDVDFRKKMSDSTDMWHLVALMTPALPWEIPVNAPLWMRRISQNALIRDDKLADQEARAEAGQLKPSEFDEYGNVIPPPMQDIEDVTAVVRDMLGYAFGPANAAELVGSGLGALPFGPNDSEAEGAVAQMETLLRSGGGGATPLVAGGPAQPGGTVATQQPPPTGQGY